MRSSFAVQSGLVIGDSLKILKEFGIFDITFRVYSVVACLPFAKKNAASTYEEMRHFEKEKKVNF